MLLKLLDKGKNIYNLALSECEKRLHRSRDDKEYQQLLAQRKRLLSNSGRLGESGASVTAIDVQLRDIVQGRYKLTKNDIEKFVKDNGGYLLEGFNSQFAQILADRAHDAVEKVLYGKTKKARKKGKWDNILGSLNSKTINTGFRFSTRDNVLLYGDMRIPLIMKYRKDHGYHKWYLDQIANNIDKHKAVDISYLRLIRRVISGKDVFYVQFVLDVRSYCTSDSQVKELNAAILTHNLFMIHRAEQKAPHDAIDWSKGRKEESFQLDKSLGKLRLKHFVSNIVEYPKTNTTLELIRSLGLAGQFETCLDMGPKHFAAFLRGEWCSIAILQPIFDKLLECGNEIAGFQRKLDRQRRAANPDNYNTEGTIRRRKHLRWKRSKGYIETQSKIRELHRLVKETRETVLNELSSILAVLSKNVMTEDVSYKSWQKSYGRSVGNFAPSYFIKDIFSKAERAGKRTAKIPLKTALSQVCLCGEKKTKNLSQRVHDCGCWVKSQRDVFSAYLGTLYVAGTDGVGGRLLLSMDHKADRQLLETSCRSYTQMVRGLISGFALGLDKGPQNHSCPNGKRQSGENHEEPRLVCADSLKLLLGELGSSLVGR